jgi:cytochrome bd-type quinol oxidase subunit 1
MLETLSAKQKKQIYDAVIKFIAAILLIILGMNLPK